MWAPNKLASPEIAALLRHTFRHIYAAFTRVETDGHLFVPELVISQSLRALKEALRRRAYTIQKMHANRKNTSLPNAIPHEAALQYASLIEMDEQGNIAGFSPTFDAITDEAEQQAKSALADLKDRQRVAERAPRKRRRDDPQAQQRAAPLPPNPPAAPRPPPAGLARGGPGNTRRPY